MPPKKPQPKSVSAEDERTQSNATNPNATNASAATVSGPRLIWTGPVATTVPSPIGRCFHNTAYGSEGKLLCFGGWDGSFTAKHIADVQCFDFGSASWQTLENVTGEPHEGITQAAAADAKNAMIFFGGWTGTRRSNALTVFEYEAQRWRLFDNVKNDPPPGLTYHTATYINHERTEKLYIFGGNHVDGQTNDMHVLDMNNLVWMTATTHGAPGKRSSHTASVVHDTQIVVIGGRGGVDGTQTLSDVAVYDATGAAGQWNMTVKIEGSLPPRYGHSALTIGHNILVFGGVSDQGALLNDIWRLNCEKPNVFVWSKVATEGQPPEPRAGHTAVESMSGMYIVGGRVNSPKGATSDIIGIDTSALAPLPTLSGEGGGGNVPDGTDSHVSRTPASEAM